MAGVTLSRAEAEFLLEQLPLSGDWASGSPPSGGWRERLEQTPRDGEVQLSEEEAFELHELCAEELVRSGFDHAYELNELGRALEWLLDKLWA